MWKLWPLVFCMLMELGGNRLLASEAEKDVIFRKNKEIDAPTTSVGSTLFSERDAIREKLSKEFEGKKREKILKKAEKEFEKEDAENERKNLISRRKGWLKTKYESWPVTHVRYHVAKYLYENFTDAEWTNYELEDEFASHVDYAISEISTPIIEKTSHSAQTRRHLISLERISQVERTESVQAKDAIKYAVYLLKKKKKWIPSFFLKEIPEDVEFDADMIIDDLDFQSEIGFFDGFVSSIEKRYQEDEKKYGTLWKEEEKKKKEEIETYRKEKEGSDSLFDEMEVLIIKRWKPHTIEQLQSYSLHVKEKVSNYIEILQDLVKRGEKAKEEGYISFKRKTIRLQVNLYLKATDISHRVDVLSFSDVKIGETKKKGKSVSPAVYYEIRRKAEEFLAVLQSEIEQEAKEYRAHLISSMGRGAQWAGLQGKNLAYGVASIAIIPVYGIWIGGKYIHKHYPEWKESRRQKQIQEKEKSEIKQKELAEKKEKRKEEKSAKKNRTKEEKESDERERNSIQSFYVETLKVASEKYPKSAIQFIVKKAKGSISRYKKPNLSEHKIAVGVLYNQFEKNWEFIGAEKHKWEGIIPENLDGVQFVIRKMQLRYIKEKERNPVSLVVSQAMIQDEYTEIKNGAVTAYNKSWMEKKRGHWYLPSSEEEKIWKEIVNSRSKVGLSSEDLQLVKQKEFEKKLQEKKVGELRRKMDYWTTKKPYSEFSLYQNQASIILPVVSNRQEISLQNMRLSEGFLENAYASYERHIESLLPITVRGKRFIRYENLDKKHADSIRHEAYRKEIKELWQILIENGGTEVILSHIEGGRTQYINAALAELLEYATHRGDVADLTEAWLDRKKRSAEWKMELVSQYGGIVPDFEGKQDDIPSAATDGEPVVGEFSETETKKRFSENSFHPLPPYFSRYVSQQDHCVACEETVEWDLVPLNQIQSEGATLSRVQDLVQVPNLQTTHKISTCGHLICKKCLQKIFREKMLAVQKFQCPQCNVGIPYWEHDAVRWEKHFGVAYGRVKFDDAQTIEDRLAAALHLDLQRWGNVLERKVGENIGKWETMGYFFGSRYDRWPMTKLTQQMKENIREKSKVTLSRWGEFFQEKTAELEEFGQPLLKKPQPKKSIETVSQGWFKFQTVHKDNAASSIHRNVVRRVNALLETEAVDEDDSDGKNKKSMHDALYLKEMLKDFLVEVNKKSKEMGSDAVYGRQHLVGPIPMPGETAVDPVKEEKEESIFERFFRIRDEIKKESLVCRIQLEWYIEGEIQRSGSAVQNKIKKQKKKMEIPSAISYPGEEKYYRRVQQNSRDQIVAESEQFFFAEVSSVKELEGYFLLQPLGEAWLEKVTNYSYRINQDASLFHGKDDFIRDAVKIIKKFADTEHFQYRYSVEFEDRNETMVSNGHRILASKKASMVDALLLELETCSRQVDASMKELSTRADGNFELLKDTVTQLRDTYKSNLSKQVGEYHAELVTLVRTQHWLDVVADSCEAIEKRVKDQLRYNNGILIQDKEVSDRILAEKMRIFSTLSSYHFAIEPSSSLIRKERVEVGTRILLSILKEKNPTRFVEEISSKIRWALQQFQASKRQIILLKEQSNGSHFFALLEKKIQSSVDDANRILQENSTGMFLKKRADDHIHDVEEILRNTTKIEGSVEDMRSWFRTRGSFFAFRDFIAYFAHDFSLSAQKLITLWDQELADVENALSYGMNSDTDRSREFSELNQRYIRSITYQLNEWLRKHHDKIWIEDRYPVLNIMLSRWKNSELDSWATPLLCQTIVEHTPSLLLNSVPNWIWEKVEVGAEIGQHSTPSVGNQMSGLANFGATCFLNTIIQSFATTRLYELLRPAHVLHQYEDEGDVQFAFRIAMKEKLFHLVNLIRMGESTEPLLREVVDLLLELKPEGKAEMKNLMRHRDAEEYLRPLLAVLEADKLCGFTLESTTTRSDSFGRKTVSVEKTREWILQLPIAGVPQEGKFTLEMLLNQYEATETLEKATPDSQETVIKSTKIMDISPMLLVAFGRFSFQGDAKLHTFQAYKNRAWVDLFGMNYWHGILLGLQGAAVHYDAGKKLTHGHYTFASIQKEKWVEHDDETPVQLALGDLYRDTYIGIFSVLRNVKEKQPVKDDKIPEIVPVASAPPMESEELESEDI